MLNCALTRSMTGVLAASLIAAAASSANAAFSYTVGADNSTQTNVLNIPPNYPTFSTSPGALYGTPIVTNSGNVITLNFDSSISPSFAASANGIVFLEQSTDGHLVLNLFFDTPVSISANVWEAGVYNLSGNGTVAVNGGEVAIEAVDPLPVESHASALMANFDGSGGWTATATTAAFANVYTDYQISIDNNLVATASDGSASIFKKDFILQITTYNSGQPPTPEPASLGVLGLGAIGLLARRRR